MSKTLPSAEQLKNEWATDPRWAGISRGYSAEEVVRLRGTVAIDHSIARLGAEKLWKYLGEKPFVNALGALTGNQAMQQVKAGLNAIYLSGWQVAADANLAGEMYPDQSLYPANQLPAFLISVFGNRTGIDHIHIGHFMKIPPGKTILFEHAPDRGGFAEIQLATQGM